MGSKRAKEIWQLGVPLSRAWLKFAPIELRSEFEKLPEFLNAIAQIPVGEGAQGFFQHLAKSVNETSARMQLERQIKDVVLTDLFNGELLAAAYREWPSRSQSPVVIEPAKFENDDPDWNSETLSVHGIRYGRIRICDPAKLRPAPSRPKGSITVINDAIDHLMRANPAFCELPRKTACAQIREFLNEDEISGSGLSDQNLGKAIVRKCGPKRISPNLN